MNRPGAVTWTGLAVVLAAAAVLSFAALRDLAITCRVSPTLAALLPLSVDAGAAVATRAWLSGRSGPEAERFSRRLTWALLCLTVVANAAHQGMAANAISPPWWAAVLVGAIPPGVLGAVVHLSVLLGRTGEQPVQAADTAPEAAATTAPEVPEKPITVAETPDNTTEPKPARKPRTRTPAAQRQADYRARKARETAGATA